MKLLFLLSELETVCAKTVVAHCLTICICQRFFRTAYSEPRTGLSDQATESSRPFKAHSNVQTTYTKPV